LEVCYPKIEECEENDVPGMLEMFNMRKDVTIGGLREMGWNGTHTETAERYFFHQGRDFSIIGYNLDIN
jgi:hypothetical protein